MNWLWKLAAIISKYQLWTLCSFFKKTSIINTSARVSCRQLSPLWSHLLMVITPSVCNYPDSDLLMFKMLFYHATHQGKFFEVHMFSISHGLVHTHTATSHSFTPGHCNQRCTAGRGDSEAVKMHLCGNCWKGRWPWCVSSRYSSSALPAKRACDNAITESADTCLQVPAPAEMNEINTPAPVQFLRRIASHKFILSWIFTVQNWLWGTVQICLLERLVIMGGRVRYWWSADTVSR